MPLIDALVKAQLLLVLIVPASWPAAAPPEIANWEYRGQLHDAISHCDRMVVRDDGFLSPRPVAQRGVLFEITNPAEIGQVIGNLHLRPEQGPSRVPARDTPASTGTAKPSASPRRPSSMAGPSAGASCPATPI